MSWKACLSDDKVVNAVPEGLVKFPFCMLLFDKTEEIDKIYNIQYMLHM